MQERLLDISSSRVKQAIGIAIWNVTKYPRLSNSSNEELGDQFLKLFNGQENKPNFSKKLIENISNQTPLLTKDEKNQVFSIMSQGFFEALIKPKGTYTFGNNSIFNMNEKLAPLGLKINETKQESIEAAKDLLTKIFNDLNGPDLKDPKIIFSRIFVLAKTVEILGISDEPLKTCVKAMQTVKENIISKSENFQIGHNLMHYQEFCINALKNYDFYIVFSQLKIENQQKISLKR